MTGGSSAALLVSYAAETDVGRVRSENQDAVLVDGWVCQRVNGSISGELMCVGRTAAFGVFDGLGGHQGGALAARTAAQAFAAAVPVTGPIDFESTVMAASSAVGQAARLSPDLGNMATTAAIVALDATYGIGVVNVGDSRVYRLWEGFFAQVTIDDRAASPRGDSQVVTQVLGAAAPPPEPHVLTFPVSAATTLLLCSDGLHDLLSERDLAQILTDLDPPRDAARFLVAEALRRGAPDNVSVVVLRVSEVRDDPADDAQNGERNGQADGSQSDITWSS